MMTQGLGSAIAPPKQVKSQAYLILTVVLGIAGSVVAVTAFGTGSYRVGALLVEMRVRPSTSGTTELGIVPPAGIGLTAGTVTRSTHAGFVALRGRVTGVIGPSSVEAIKDTVNPLTLAKTIRDQGKSAFRKFGLRIGLLVLAGGASGGFAIALVGMKARRIFQGALAGLIVSALIALIAWQTYDIGKFSTVSFKAGVVGALLNR